ncbi:MAG: hypothetical protein ACQERB_02895 [Promethearchaeati archaeon]
MGKEEWDYKKFISLYNKIALKTGEWVHEENYSDQELKQKYEQSADPTIQEFAEHLFHYEQRH